MKITKKTKLIELLQKKPKATEILTDIGMGCIGCPMAMMETIEDGCKAHGMSDKEIDDSYKGHFTFGGRVLINMHKHLTIGDSYFKHLRVLWRLESSSVILYVDHTSYNVVTSLVLLLYEFKRRCLSLIT